MSSKEEIIIKVLDEDTNNLTHLADCDRKCIAHILAKILDAIEESALEQKRKEVSDEMLAKLDILTELGHIHDEIKKIPWYRFSARNELKWKIRYLDSMRLYGRHLRKNIHNSLEPVEVAPT